MCHWIIMFTHSDINMDQCKTIKSLQGGPNLRSRTQSFHNHDSCVLRRWSRLLPYVIFGYPIFKSYYLFVHLIHVWWHKTMSLPPLRRWTTAKVTSLSGLWTDPIRRCRHAGVQLFRRLCCETSYYNEWECCSRDREPYKSPFLPSLLVRSWWGPLVWEFSAGDVPPGSSHNLVAWALGNSFNEAPQCSSVNRRGVPLILRWCMMSNDVLYHVAWRVGHLDGPYLATFIYEKWYLNIFFMTTFATTFSLILTLIFTLSLYCFDFRANIYSFFANYDCLYKLSIKDCSNNTPLYLFVDNQ